MTLSILLEQGVYTYYLSPKNVTLAANGDQLQLDHEITLNFNESTPYKIKIEIVMGTSPNVKYLLNGLERDI